MPEGSRSCTAHPLALLADNISPEASPAQLVVIPDEVSGVPCRHLCAVAHQRCACEKRNLLCIATIGDHLSRERQVTKRVHDAA